MAIRQPYTGMMGVGTVARTGHQLRSDPRLPFRSPSQPVVRTGGPLPPQPITGTARPVTGAAQPAMPSVPSPAMRGLPMRDAMPQRPAMPRPAMMQAPRQLATNGLPEQASAPVGRPPGLDVVLNPRR